MARISDSHRIAVGTLIRGTSASMLTRCINRRLRTRCHCGGPWHELLSGLRMLTCATAALAQCALMDRDAVAEENYWLSSPWQVAVEGQADSAALLDYRLTISPAEASDRTFSLWDSVPMQRAMDYSVTPVQFDQPNGSEQLPQPSQPSFLEPEESEMSVAE